MAWRSAASRRTSESPSTAESITCRLSSDRHRSKAQRSKKRPEISLALRSRKNSRRVAAVRGSALALFQRLDLVGELIDLGRHAGERADHLVDTRVGLC